MLCRTTRVVSILKLRINSVDIYTPKGFFSVKLYGQFWSRLDPVELPLRMMFDFIVHTK